MVVGFSSLCNRALTSCCAVARAQHLGQNGRFAQQQPLRGWLRAAQHAIFGALHFSLQAKKQIGPLFLVVVVEKHLIKFAICRRLLFFFRHLCQFAVAEKKLNGACQYSVLAVG